MAAQFSDKARKVMALANQESARLNHEYIGTEHILLGMLNEDSGIGAVALRNMGVDLARARREADKLMWDSPDGPFPGQSPQTPRAKKVIQYALDESKKMGHNYVGTEHLLLGLLSDSDGVAAQILINLGLKLENVREEVLKLRQARSE